MFPAVLFLLLTLICEGGASSSADTSTELDKTITTSVTYVLKAAGCGLAGLAVLIVCLASCTDAGKRNNELHTKTESDALDAPQEQKAEVGKQRDGQKKQRGKLEKLRGELEKQREELEKLREELEKQRCQLGKQIEENEKEREKNKQKLQSVEREITEGEKMFNKPEELLRKKENLLQAQWKLDETKKMLEKQILDRDKVLEPIESLLRSNRQTDVIISID
ncbi:uncharacterized protein AB9X84_015516 [Acanthopagrus schlegelii]